MALETTGLDQPGRMARGLDPGEPTLVKETGERITLSDGETMLVHVVMPKAEEAATAMKISASTIPIQASSPGTGAGPPSRLRRRRSAAPMNCCHRPTR